MNKDTVARSELKFLNSPPFKCTTNLLFSRSIYLGLTSRNFYYSFTTNIGLSVTNILFSVTETLI